MIDKIYVGVDYKESIEGANISPIFNQTFEGSVVTPKPVVSLNGETLEEGVDYEVVYENNNQIGTASLKVKGCGKYKDIIESPFEIVAPDWKSVV